VCILEKKTIKEEHMNKLFIKRILVFGTVVSLGILALNISAKAAEIFPSGPIEFVVCYPPGGGADVAARIVIPAVANYIGVPISITNKAGGEGSVGVSYSLNKKPDGYTLFGLHQFSTFVGAVFGQLPYDFQEIYPICNWIDNLNIFAVQASSPFKTFKELVAYAKQNPGKLKYSLPTTRTSQGIGAELLKSNAGIDIVPVPFKGSGPAMTALLGGHVDLSSVPYAMAKPHIQAGTVRALVVFGKRRVKEIPDVPTAVDLGYEEAPLAFAGAGCSAKVSKDRIEKISLAFEKAMKDPKVLAQLEKAGLEPVYMDPEEFKKHILEGFSKVNKIKDKLKE
jgi:tripartite-type tricarboxylate transporter receptor subunit TctC